MGLSNSDVMPLIASGGYEVEQSLRFEADDTPYLSRTPSSTGNQKTWTWSAWVKRTEEYYGDRIFACTPSDQNDTHFKWLNGSFNFQHYNGSTLIDLRTTPLYRDPAAWYHFVVIYDSANSTSSDRVRIYVNGERITEFSTETYPSQNLTTNFNSTTVHYIGRAGQANNSNFSGYLAENHFIDGQTLDPTYFGETDETYGHWKPIQYTGSYGTNGFYLNFSGTFYNDQSGNSNNFSATNLSTSDVVLDSPTNNFNTINHVAIDPSAYDQPTIIQGSLVIGTNGNSNSFGLGTMSLTSGKWYYEQIVTSSNGGHVGITEVDSADQYDGSHLYDGGSNPDGWGYYKSGQIHRNGTYTNYGDSFTTNDLISCAFDLDNGKIWFAKNGTWQNSGNPASGTNAAYTNVEGTVVTRSGHYNSDAADYFNFGQDGTFVGNKTAQGNTDDNGYGDFYYSPPSGFLAMCTKNLPDPAVVPKEVFNTILWDGNSSNPRSITGVGFQPDVVWGKIRSAVGNHYVMDSSRGSGTGTLKVLNADTNDSEQTNNSGGSTSFGVYTSIDSDGFTVTSGSSSAKNTNETSQKYVAWNWKVNGGTTSSNTSGSITSTVQVNQDAGFSIITYTGNGTQGATIGHGLSQAPEFFQTKVRNTSNNWHGWHKGLSGAGYSIEFDIPNTEASNSNHWDDTEPSSSVITLGTNGGINGNGNNYVCYAWHSVPGYSKVGSFTGNANSDGPFIWTGFKPDLIIFKPRNIYEDWTMIDSTRDSYNPAGRNWVYVDGSSGGSLDGSNTKAIDYYSNGFKPRVSTSFFNNNDEKYIYIAFAETPFKYANAR